jgi:hypothetical protein
MNDERKESEIEIKVERKDGLRTFNFRLSTSPEGVILSPTGA